MRNGRGRRRPPCLMTPRVHELPHEGSSIIRHRFDLRVLPRPRRCRRQGRRRTYRSPRCNTHERTLAPTLATPIIIGIASPTFPRSRRRRIRAIRLHNRGRSRADLQPGQDLTQREVVGAAAARCRLHLQDTKPTLLVRKRAQILQHQFLRRQITNFVLLLQSRSVFTKPRNIVLGNTRATY